MKVLVTGASGFVGKYLGVALAQGGHRATGLCRQAALNSSYRDICIGDMTALAEWKQALDGCDVVIHLAARAHVLSGSSDEQSELEQFRRVNRDATLALAVEAARRGVRRFVFVSSIGVNGNSSGSTPFDESSTPAPHASYAVSKFEAEEGLLRLAADSAMDIVIIRPPLVYAFDAPGNFARLLQLVANPIPLPFGAVDNGKSLISVANLVDFIILCMTHPNAANERFIVADNGVVSIRELIAELAAGMGKKAFIFSVPERFLSGAAALVGRTRLYEQLCANLELDTRKAKRLLGWQPLQGLREGLREAGRKFVSTERADG
ncbi:NAD-dependent epimerase/dehydratase family protein [Pseudomonas nicosulfuronedens]|uniref:NAD-dependent epimerase/dehydratase family protein n=1 Tax=Pseudomonas nicosulfuronedens TaxID=2571105 RepID=UPI0014873109|nr:NAD-dependent epimerase/dehydratase family protein [Pseudomonas nicosulfuronedens]MDH1010521.1 NAD-dependent epimerase/dehydratase family protein [Pseudomonas nicosulfuronedens]MDH1979615.1 NAD-dependent epimerase/dehydratase family protein [Pseudomonas nicosulfuronedens]MDH2028050.1 NAD-dependent epimerase/dehydratase family protein [Pseudomonas nicosulfuronedens]